MKTFRDFIFEQIGRMRIIMLGGPGSGKSTYSKYLIDHFDITHIYPGGMLRKEIEKGKKKYEMIRNDGLRFIDSNENEIYFAIATYVTLQRVKNFLVSKMNQIKSIGTFLQTDKGFRVTDPEGYVAVDRLGNAVKLVDRLEFSKANFNTPKNWIRGWEKN